MKSPAEPHPVKRQGNAVVLHILADQIGQGFQFAAGIAHRHAYAGPFQHCRVVHAVAEGYRVPDVCAKVTADQLNALPLVDLFGDNRSEERRVGKECRL